MPDALTSLRHPDTPRPDDAALAQASRAHVAKNGALQLVAELLTKLRGSRFPWWTPDLLRGTWDATERLGWFAQRPDIRQRITCSLTGLKPKAARNKQPDFQATLIDSVIDDGDVTVEQFENEFDAVELAAYAPAALIWQQFRSRMPWGEDAPPHQELVSWLFDRLLASYSTIDGMAREPILTPYAIRTTIPGRIWHSRIPLEVRVAIDELRFEHERSKPGEPFHAIHDLSVATPTIIATNIPLQELLCVLDVAERAMGLPPARELPQPAPRAKVAEPVKPEPPKADAKPEPAPPAGERAPEKMMETPRAEPPKADARAAPAAAPVEKAPEKQAEKPGTMDRWERMANKVLEKVGKESNKTEESWSKDR